ncbi:unnamed protein product [Leptidea sinapis]|uniref:Uncharacterized protein n=1 Tax=Leptidea sinapis TaxID=189913 RepID=A0A5E4QJB3_9NEOP|nr:unnamed protein product [Leptidea sinapis]
MPIRLFKRISMVYDAGMISHIKNRIIQYVYTVKESTHP